MSSLQIRALTNSDADYAARLTIDKALNPTSTLTLEEIKYWDDWWDPQYHRYRFIAELSGEPVAMAECAEWPWWYEPGRYALYIDVMPAFRRQGIGGKLYEQLLTTLSNVEPKGRILMCKCLEDQPESERFIRKRGFPLVGKEPASMLDVPSFAAEKFADLLERVRQQGIEIINYDALVARVPDWQQQCFEMHWASRQSMPATGTHTRQTFEQYVQQVFEHDKFMPSAFFVALDHGQVVGASNLINQYDDREHLHTDYTGVIPSHRRRGIATALKVRVIQQAQAQGVKTIRTGNHETNPMYQINLQLGFQPQPGELLFELKLA